MSEIQRWEVGFSQMNEHDQGEFVTWNDHCAALKAARNELPDVGSWTPEAKFKVGDRVRWGKDLGTVTEPEREPDYITINWDDGNYGTVIFSDLELIAPPVTTCGCPGGYAKVAEVPTSARPERKFKIGNQVTHRDSKKVRKIKNYYFSSEDNEWKYDIGFYYVESELTLHIAPTPAELIPTLVDRVRDMKDACIEAVGEAMSESSVTRQFTPNIGCILTLSLGRKYAGTCPHGHSVAYSLTGRR